MSVRHRWFALAGLLAALAGAGLFLLGRVTAPDPNGRGRAYYDGYFAGLQAGEVQGREEGRAIQEVAGLPADARAGARQAYRDGYAAGFNDVFAGYDGGWELGVPYAIVVTRGTGGTTYRIADRQPLRPGVDYYRCSSGLCSEPRR
jgi:hypothetical protein